MRLTALSAALGLSIATLRRRQEAGVIVPKVAGAGRTPALWDPLAVARRLLTDAAAVQTPRDRKDEAQAQLLELRFKREMRQVLDRGEVVREGAAVVGAMTAALLRLPGELVRTEVIPAAGEAAVDAAIREALTELTRLELVAGAEAGA